MRGYEELDRVATPWGEALLASRAIPGQPGERAYEVKLAGALLMSSLVTESERALSTLALAPPAPPRARVMVGGLGLGYTALEALAQPGVREVEVVDLLPCVLRWHREGLVPMGPRLLADTRCRLVEADVFACLAAAPAGGAPGWDAILLDVDHSPEALLRPEHGSFYDEAGLRAAARHLVPGGVLGIWSALAPEPGFTARLERAVGRAQAHAVEFWNVNNDAQEVNSVYLAWR